MMRRFEPIFVRSLDALRRSLQADSFAEGRITDVRVRRVTFSESSGDLLAFPVHSSRGDVVIVSHHGHDIEFATHHVNSRGGNPSPVIEKAP